MKGIIRFIVSWFEQFGFNEGDFGLADVLARAKNTSVDGVSDSGIVQSGRGKVKLLHWREYDPGTWDPTRDKRPTVWEATNHLIERLEHAWRSGVGAVDDQDALGHGGGGAAVGVSALQSV